MWFATDFTPGTERTASTKAPRCASEAIIPQRWTTPFKMTTAPRRVCDQFMCKSTVITDHARPRVRGLCFCWDLRIGFQSNRNQRLNQVDPAHHTHYRMAAKDRHTLDPMPHHEFGNVVQSCILGCGHHAFCHYISDTP